MYRFIHLFPPRAILVAGLALVVDAWLAARQGLIVPMLSLAHRVERLLPLLAMQFYSASAALPGAIFSVWHNISGSFLAGIWSRDHKSDE